MMTNKLCTPCAVLEKRSWVGAILEIFKIKIGIEPLLGDKMFEHECAVVQYFIGNVNIPFFASKTSDLIYF